MHIVKLIEESLNDTEKRIYNKLKEIRQILSENENENLLSMCIYKNGDIAVNNTYWELPEEKQIDFYIEQEA